MKRPLPLLVFTDLDGTLLDHDSYSWAAASPALAALKAIGAGIVLASSKTGPEVQVLRAELGLNEWPAIVENGAGLLEDVASATSDYASIRTVLANAPHRNDFVGFGDLSAAEVSELTGLSRADADRAKQRAYSEPGLWSGSDQGRADFLKYLRSHGITGREGGRFLTLSFGRTKADQMAQIIDTLKPRRTVALGDAPNDVEMLQTADRAVVVSNPHRERLPTLPEEATGKIIRTQEPGPIGWNHAVLQLLKDDDLIGVGGEDG